jgi:anti-sigma-K factor RskA
MTADIHALTGAYALNAIPELERAAFERHLAECGACAQEVAELQATAARLGESVAEAPRPELKAAVMARIGEIRQLPPVGVESTGEDDEAGPSASRRLPWAARILGLAAAVLLVASVAMGVALYRTSADLADSQARAAAMSEILSAGDAKLITGSAGDLSGTVVYSRERGDVLLLANGVPAAPEGKDFQVWLMGGDTPFHSVGLISADGEGRVAILDDTGEIASATNIGITVEPDGGSERPSTEPIMAMDLD